MRNKLMGLSLLIDVLCAESAAHITRSRPSSTRLTDQARRYDREGRMDQPAFVDPPRRQGRRRRAGALDDRRRAAERALSPRLQRRSLPVGTAIIVEGFRARDGSARANGRNITFADGSSPFVGSFSIESTR